MYRWLAIEPAILATFPPDAEEMSSFAIDRLVPVETAMNHERESLHPRDCIRARLEPGSQHARFSRDGVVCAFSLE